MWTPMVCMYQKWSPFQVILSFSCRREREREREREGEGERERRDSDRERGRE